MHKEKQAAVLKYLLERIYRADKHKNQLDARVKNWTSDIESRILEQKKEIDQAITQVMDIIDYLPVNSIERQICELRHIDFKPWGAVSAEIPMSRSQVHRKYKAAVNLLLKNQYIQSIVEEYEDEYDTYMHGKWAKEESGGYKPEKQIQKKFQQKTAKK